MSETPVIAPVRLNIGSGQRRFGPEGGWINIDANPKWTPDLVADWSHLEKFDDATVDLIVAHHVIEHVGLGEFDGAVREAWRVLKPGGSLIVTTPDLDALTRAYVRGRMPNGEPFSYYLFCVNLYGAYMDSELDRHAWTYTGVALAESLYKACAWSRVAGFDWREIEGARIAKDWWILGVEAIK